MAVSGVDPQYPAVRPMDRTVDVADVPKADVSLLIRSISGTPLYFLDCHSAGYAGDPNFEYSGDFECRLSSVAHNDVYSTLLTEDVNQSKDWESRARFFATDVEGQCAHIAEFGAVRNFKLRRMKLTLEIVDPKVGVAGKLKSLKLKVTVRPDPSADRSIAAIVPLPKEAPPQCMIDRYFPDPARYTRSQ